MIKCFVCKGGKMLPKVVENQVNIGALLVEVEIEAMVCASCGFYVFTEAQSVARDAVIDAALVEMRKEA